MTTLLASASVSGAFAAVRGALRPHRARLSIVFFLGLSTAIVGLIGPWSVGRLVDALLEQPSMNIVLGWAAAVVVAGALGGIGTWVGSVLLARVLEPTIAQLREEVLDAALALDSATIENSGSGDVISRIADDSREVSRAASTVVPLVIHAGFTVVVSAIGMTAVDWRLGLIGLIAIPLYWTTLRAYLPKSAKMYKKEREAFGLRTQRLLGAVEGVATLRAYDAQQTELRRINDASAGARDISISVFRFVTWAFSRNNRAEAIVLMLLLGAGFFLVEAGALSVGAVSTAALIFHRLFGPIGVLVGMFDDIQSASASLMRMVGVIETAAKLPQRELGVPQTSIIELVRVTHKYEHNPVLSDVSLALQPGQHIAIVGASGAGKSTVANIMAGLLVPSSGSVTVGGVAMEQLDPRQLRRHVVMVSQEVHCFRASIMDNVRIARPDATDVEVMAAIKQVGDAWLASYEDGVDTIIGDGGQNLSGMEAQLLALARVELADPQVVILDEATAEAGSGHARVLEDAAQELIRNRSAIIIAHRLSQATEADLIIVMAEGRIVETGTHPELVAAAGVYQRLWEAWSG